MSAFCQGNNEEYLVHVIAIKRLLEQKVTDQDVRKAFQVVVEVRKELEPLLEAQKDTTEYKNEEQKQSSLRSRRTSRPHANLQSQRP